MHNLNREYTFSASFRSPEQQLRRCPRGGWLLSPRGWARGQWSPLLSLPRDRGLALPLQHGLGCGGQLGGRVEGVQHRLAAAESLRTLGDIHVRVPVDSVTCSSSHVTRVTSSLVWCDDTWQRGDGASILHCHLVFCVCELNIPCSNLKGFIIMSMNTISLSSSQIRFGNSCRWGR